MDTETRLKKSLEFSKYRETLANQLQLLRLKKSAEFDIFVAGGSFTIDRSLIVFVDMLLNRELTEAVLLDNNDNPIKITDLAAFHEDILDRYISITNTFYDEYERTRKVRDAQSILDLDD